MLKLPLPLHSDQLMVKGSETCKQAAKIARSHLAYTYMCYTLHYHDILYYTKLHHTVPYGIIMHCKLDLHEEILQKTHSERRVKGITPQLKSSHALPDVVGSDAPIRVDMRDTDPAPQ